MAITHLTGETEKFESDTAGTNSGSWTGITIPSSADYMVVCVSTYQGSGATTYFQAPDYVRIDDGTTETAMTVLSTAPATAAAHITGIFGLDVSSIHKDPNTVDFEWDWDGTAAMNGNDITAHALFFSGVDATGTASGQTDADENTSGAELSVTLSSVSSGNFVLARYSYFNSQTDEAFTSSEPASVHSSSEGTGNQNCIVGVYEVSSTGDQTVTADSSASFHSLGAIELVAAAAAGGNPKGPLGMPINGPLKRVVGP